MSGYGTLDAVTVLQLILSLAVVTLGAEALVRGASALALRLGVSPLFIGLTIVGFGTSSPELAASVTATLRGATGVSVGNVVGSNIFNIAVIVALTAMITPLRVELRAVRRDLAVAVAAALAPTLAFMEGGSLGPALGFGFLLVLAAYLVVAYRGARTASLELAELDGIVAVPSSGPSGGPWREIALAAVGLVLLIVGARFFVDAAIELAQTMRWSERLIGLTVVAAGTSLPELATSVVAGLRRNPDIAIGNVIGSNIFNVFGILGLSAVVHPQTISWAVLSVDVPVMLAATLALLPIVKTGGRISRREGLLLLVGYGAYLAGLIVFAQPHGGAS
jgi:cation:H+ antiporter